MLRLLSRPGGTPALKYSTTSRTLVNAALCVKFRPSLELTEGQRAEL